MSKEAFKNRLMKRIIEYILFVINTTFLVYICFFYSWIINENYNFDLNEISPFLELFIVLSIIVINTYLFIKQKKRFLISIILFLIIVACNILFTLNQHNECEDDSFCLQEYIYKGEISFENEETTSTYIIAIHKLDDVIFSNECNIPAIYNYGRKYIGDDISTSMKIDCYDTIKNQQFIIENSYEYDCELGTRRISNILKAPIRIFKNGNLIVDTCLKIKPNMIKYRNNKIEIQFDEFKIKN